MTITRENAVKLYLLHSYLYYELDTSIIEDYEFNSICKFLLENFDSIEHMHKHLIDKDSLKANTGYTLVYPEIIKYIAHKLVVDY